MKIDLKDNHFLLTSSAEMKEICNPLLNHSCVNYADYHHYDFKTGAFYGLNTLAPLSKVCLENRLYPTANELKALPNISYGIISPEVELPFGVDKKKYEKNIEICNGFNAIHRLYILNITEDYAEYYGFGSGSSIESVIPFYINNMDVLEKFILYLQSKMERLLKEAKENAIILPHFINENKNISNKINKSSEFDRVELLEFFNATIKNISSKNSKFNLTPREIQILTKIAEGWTYKEIASRFGISQRTVEVHVQNIKLKTQCFSKTHLRELGKKRIFR